MPSTDREKFAARLAAAIQAQGLDLTTFAARVGVSYQQAWFWQTARRQPSLPHLATILKVLSKTNARHLICGATA